jgi:N-ethylmaleimide reductase
MNAPESLLSPFDLHGLRVKNRVALAPMTRARAGASRLPNPMMAEYYAQRSGVGLLISEATTVAAQGNGWVGSPGIYTDEMGAAWKPVVDAVHDRDTPFFLQLWHCGRASHRAFHGGDLPVSASAIKLDGDHIHTPDGKREYETPRALETDELPGVVAAYVAAARRAREAGFDGVEIHSANGYLLDQFLQSKTNHRGDAYGGSLENRFRLLREIVEGIATVYPAHRIAVRLSPNGVFNDMGSPDYRETFRFAARELDTYGLAYLHVMDGLGFGFHELGDPMTLPDFREVFRGPLMGNCGYDAVTADAAIASGAADMIAIGRPMIANPDYVERIREGWPLAPLADMEVWYSGESTARGYTDFPAYDPRTESAEEVS